MQRVLRSRRLRGLTLFWLVLSTLPALAQDPDNFARDRAGVQVGLGGGLALILPVVHAEVRYAPAPKVSLAAFLTGSAFTLEWNLFGTDYERGVLLANMGGEGRYHFRPTRWLDLHAGAGAGSILVFAGDTIAAMPMAWLNVGVTVAPAPRLRIDLELSPAINLQGDIAPLPVLRARFLL